MPRSELRDSRDLLRELRAAGCEPRIGSDGGLVLGGASSALPAALIAGMEACRESLERLVQECATLRTRLDRGATYLLELEERGEDRGHDYEKALGFFSHLLGQYETYAGEGL